MNEELYTYLIGAFPNWVPKEKYATPRGVKYATPQILPNKFCLKEGEYSMTAFGMLIIFSWVILRSNLISVNRFRGKCLLPCKLIITV